MSTDIWDQFAGSDEYFKFNEIGDSVAGEVVTVTVKQWQDGKESPQLLLKLDDGTTTTVTAGPVMLQRALAEQRPRPGDRVAIAYTGVGEAQPGRSAPKLFDVAVKRADSAAESATAETPATTGVDASSLL